MSNLYTTKIAFPNYSYISHNGHSGIFIPSGDIKNIDNFSITGDGRKVMWGLLETSFSGFSSITGSENINHMSFSKSSLQFIDNQSGIRINYSQGFNFSFPDKLNLKDEG